MPRPARVSMAVSAALLLGALPAAGAQEQVRDQDGSRAPRAALAQWGFDPDMLVADGRELLRRAPDPAIDRLFQAVHAAATSPDAAPAACELFDPAADRSLAGLNALAARLGPGHHERLATAIANVFVEAMRAPPQPFDEAAARQALKAAGVRAALRNDGFGAGLAGDDHPARCRSLGWLLDALQPQPLAERAAVTRLLLGEGLARLAAGP